MPPKRRPTASQQALRVTQILDELDRLLGLDSGALFACHHG